MFSQCVNARVVARAIQGVVIPCVEGGALAEAHAPRILLRPWSDVDKDAMNVGQSSLSIELKAKVQQ
jgi:hypothetical protein